MSTINVRSYKGPVRPDGTPIELPQKVLILFPIKNAPNPLPTSNTDDCIF